jgi:hypothetical protein
MAREGAETLDGKAGRRGLLPTPLPKLGVRWLALEKERRRER